MRKGSERVVKDKKWGGDVEKIPQISTKKGQMGEVCPPLL